MRKFLCYDTEQAARGEINVDSQGMLRSNSTVPSTNGVPHQQLVTDDKGEVRWEDRLAYEVTGWKDFTLDFNERTEITGFTMPPVGDTVIVKVNGVESIETVKLGEMEEQSYSYIGSTDLLGLNSGDKGWIVFNAIDCTVGLADPETTVSLFITTPSKIKYEYLPDDLLKSPYPIQIVDFDKFLLSFGFEVFVVAGSERTYDFSLSKEKWDEFLNLLSEFAQGTLCVSGTSIVSNVKPNAGHPEFNSIKFDLNSANAVFCNYYTLDVSYNEETETVTAIKSIIKKELT